MDGGVINISGTILIGVIIGLIVAALIWIFKNLFGRYKINIFKWFRRKYWRLFPVKFSIAFSIESQDGHNSGKYFREIKKNILEILIQNNLLGEVAIEDCSEVYHFTDKTKAEAFQEKENIDLLVWGRFSGDGLRYGGEEILDLEGIKFTYGHPENKEKQIQGFLNQDFSSKFAIKNYWKIRESESGKDVKIVSHNLFHISMYIIGMTTMLYGRILESTKIFLGLYDSLKNKSDPLEESVKIQLSSLLQLVILEEYGSKRNVKSGIKYCLRLLEVAPDDRFGLCNLAFFYYQDGQKEESEKMVIKQQRKYPRDGITEVNVAFLRMIQQRYEEGYDCYNRLVCIKRVELGFEPLEVVEFLDNQYGIRKEPALLYGSGILLYYYGDNILAERDLTKFLKFFNEEDCKGMYGRAKNIVAKLQKPL